MGRMQDAAANPSKPRRAARVAVLALAAVTFAFSPVCNWTEQARLFVAYVQATAQDEEPMGLMERITVSFLMAGNKAGKTKEAGAKPASPGQRI